MKAFKFIAIIAIIATATISSCSSERAALVQNKSGAQLWGETCIRCHNTPSPASFNDTDWRTIELHMKVRANLPKAQSDKIFEFIRSVN